MANNASISLTIDLKAFVMGLKTALSMGKVFGDQLNKALSGNVKIDTKAFDNALERYEKQLEELNSEEIDINADPAATSLTKVRREAEKSGISLVSMFKKVRAELSEWGFAIRGASSLLTQFKNGFEFLIGASRDVESLKLRLEGMYQDADLAAAAYSKFLDIAKNTPATLQQVTQAGATLKAFGMDAEATLESAVDLASYMGMDLVEAASAMGRSFQGGVGASEILRERGVLALIKSFSGIEDLTKLTLPEFRKVMLEVLSDPSAGIAGSAERVAKSLAGTASNFEDAMYRLRESIGGAFLPTFTRLLHGMIEFVDLLTGMNGGLRWMLVLLPLATVLWYQLTLKIAAASGGLVSFGTALGTVQVALSKFLITMGPVGWIMMAATAGLTAYAFASTKAKNEIEKTDSELEKSKQKVKESAERMKVLTERLGELRNKTKLSADEHKEMRNIIKIMNDNYGSYIGNINLEKDSWNEVAGALAKARDRMIEYQMASAYEDMFKKQLKTVADLRIKLDELGEKQKKGAFNQDLQDMYAGGQGDVQKYWDVQNSIINSGISETQKQLIDAEAKLKKYNAAWLQSVQNIGGTNSGEGDEDGKAGDKAVNSKAATMDGFYKEMRFKAAGYYDYMLGVYERDKREFIAVTGDKDKAEAQYAERVRLLGEERTKWEAELQAMNAEELAALKLKNDAVDKYYSTVKFAADDYYDYQVGLLNAERIKYIELTGDKTQAEALYIAQVKKLDEEYAIWKNNQLTGSINKEREGFVQQQGDFDAQIARLETWKNLGLGVGDALAKAWEEYYALLKKQAEESALSYKKAEQDKTNVSVAELKLRQELADKDAEAAADALNKLRQINLQNAKERKETWESEHRGSVVIWNGMVSGFSDMWRNMTSTTMTGAEKWKSAWNTMLNTVYDTLGNIASEWLKNQLYRLAVHESTEAAQTAATAEGEAARTGIIGTSIIAQTALKIAGAIKAVGIYLFEAAAALIAWYAKIFGPAAPLAMMATMGLAVKAVNSFRKGFKTGSYTGDGDPNEVAGVVHKREFVFENSITSKNLKELGSLRALLQKGYRLKDLLLPSINLQYAPVPTPAGGGGYYGGGYTGNSGDMMKLMQGMLDETRAMRRMWESGSIKSKMSFSKRELAMAMDQGNRERRTVKR